MPTLFKSKTIESDLNYNLKDLNIKSGVSFLEVVPFLAYMGILGNEKSIFEHFDFAFGFFLCFSCDRV